MVSSGSLLLEGASFPSSAQFTVQGNGAFPSALGGFGMFGKSYLTIAILDLNSVNGNFGLARFPFLQLAPSVTVDYEVNGMVPGQGFTQVVVDGVLILDNALLSLNLDGFKPPVGQPLVLIKGATALFETFRNVVDGMSLREGSTFTVDGMTFKISYQAGAGHDVVVTRQADANSPSPTPAPTSVPTGKLNYNRYLPFVAGDR